MVLRAAYNGRFLLLSKGKGSRLSTVLIGARQGGCVKFHTWSLHDITALQAWIYSSLIIPYFKHFLLDCEWRGPFAWPNQSVIAEETWSYFYIWPHASVKGYEINCQQYCFTFAFAITSIYTWMLNESRKNYPCVLQKPPLIRWNESRFVSLNDTSLNMKMSFCKFFSLSPSRVSDLRSAVNDLDSHWF